MSVKRTTFKQRIRKNDMKMRHEVGEKVRKRMRAARRVYNRNDLINDSSRSMEMIVSDIAEGTAMPSQETVLDPRSLTDLLLRPAQPATAVSAAPAASASSSSAPSPAAPKGNAGSSAQRKAVVMPQLAAAKVLLSTPLAADDPQALPDTRLYEEEDRQQRLVREAAAQQNENKNLYKHRGQAYLFWERVGLHPVLLQALRDLRFTHPTPVQEEVLPHVLAESNPELAKQLRAQGEKKPKKQKQSTGADGESQVGAQDVVVSAETGSGKTLVFALPILQDLLTKMEKAGVTIGLPPADEESAAVGESGDGASTATPTATLPQETREERSRRIMHTLIISPTRELALQIYAAVRQLTKFAPQVVVGCVVGGMAQERQQRVLNRHPHLLICTPGRLWDLVQKNEGCYLGHSISRRLSYVVLDEADKMLQSGRFEELQTLLERIHCEVLPAGFVQEREEGAETGDMAMVGGRWDSVKRRFVPFTKEEAVAEKAKGKEVAIPESDAKAAAEVSKKSKKSAKRRREEEEEEEEVAKPAKGKKAAAEAGKAEKKGKKAKKVAKSSAGKRNKGQREEEEEEEDAEEEDEVFDEEEMMDDHGDADEGEVRVRSRKDEPHTIPMPPDPPADHRVVTYVTSATLSLQTNYERRDYSARKSVIRTSNADVLNKVLQQLEIKPSNAHVFSLAESATVAARINETYLRCPDKSKDLYLYYFLKTYSDERAIVFVNAISMLRRLVKLLEVLGIAVVGLHASMQQRQRLKFIDKFKKGDIRVLVATDVASRGLDIDGLKYVVHHQVPRSTDAYIHRCGRTARCGGTGLSMLLVNAEEHMSFRKLMESLGRKDNEIETFAVQPSVVHQLNSHLRIALQIDKLQKEIGKSKASNRWVNQMTTQADIDTDDMFDDSADNENRAKLKAIRILQRELLLLTNKFTGQYGGKGAFRTSASALGAKEAEQKLKERADRQTVRVGTKVRKEAKKETKSKKR